MNWSRKLEWENNNLITYAMHLHTTYKVFLKKIIFINSKTRTIVFILKIMDGFRWIFLYFATKKLKRK